VEAACNDEKDSRDYEELHAKLRTFHEDVRGQEGGENWHEMVLPNLPTGMFDRLILRKRGEDIETTAETEDQQLFLRKLFLASSQHPRQHRQDMEIIKDLQIQAIRWRIQIKRASLDLARKSGDLDGSIRISQEILHLEIYLRGVEREE
jgi:hypothetical protein